MAAWFRKAIRTRSYGTAATRWGSYDIKGRDDLSGKDYEISHGGYDARFVQEDPDRLVPLDAMREMEKSGVIGKLHDEFISTSGRANPLSNTCCLGREMAEKAKREGVDAVNPPPPLEARALAAALRSQPN